MSDADDKSSTAETNESLLQSATSGQVVVPETENIEGPMKPIVVMPVAHQYSA